MTEQLDLFQENKDLATKNRKAVKGFMKWRKAFLKELRRQEREEELGDVQELNHLSI